MRPLDLLYEAMERGEKLATEGRAKAVQALERAEKGALAPLLGTAAGQKLARAVRGPDRRRGGGSWHVRAAAAAAAAAG